MTKLSDSLRSAADRAPLGDATVNVDSVASRVRLQRGMRGGANGIVGAGAVAVLAFGVATPFLGGMGTAGADLGRAGEGALPPDSNFAAAEDAAGTRLADWGTCGTYPLEWLEADGGFAASSAWEGGEFEGGELIEAPVTVVGGEPGEYYTSGPIAVVLWDGMVVATAAPSIAVVDELTVAEGDPIEGVAVTELVNCRTGEPLPPQKYELLISQQFTAEAIPPASPEADAGDPGTSGPPPSTASSETPLPEPAISVGGLIGGDAVDPNAEPSQLPADTPVVVAQYRAVAEPLPFSVAGEPVENPFPEFQPEPWTPPALPEGALSPEQAREWLAGAMTDARWDMTAGTSRVLPASGYDAAADASGGQLRYGCSWDGDVTTFPTRSAAIDLLDVEVDAPSTMNVSYGWVVDGNPEVSVSVTNASDYSLPGFWGDPGVSLYLVDGSGKVVAEGYPTNVDRNGGIAYAEDGARAADAATDSLVLPAPGGDGYLEPGDSLSGTYLWRDISACWADGEQQELRAGTYTLVSARYLYLQSWGESTVAGGEPEELREEAADGDADSGSGAGADVPAIDEYYPQEDWLELQVWTSHGTLRVTTS